MSNFSLPTLVPPDEAAKIVKKSPQSLANDRVLKRGLPWVKLGGRVLYDINDIRAAIEKGRVTPDNAA